MRRLKLPWLIAVAGASAGASAPAPSIDNLHLVCLGAGSANKSRTTTAYVTASNGTSAWGNVVGNRDVPFEDQVNIEIAAGEGRIRMPRTMLPIIRGGENGWFKLKNLRITNDEITASAAVNLINNPKVRIDRITGTLTLAGKAGSFSGECQPFDPATAQRRF